MNKFKRDVNFYWEYFFKGEDKSEDVSRTKFLRSLPFFRRMSLRQIRTINDFLHVRKYSDNEFLFEHGVPGAALFLIFQGEVAIEVPTDGGTTLVATLNDHSFLGEMALLSNAERTASARTTKKTTCFALYRRDLERLSESSPEIAVEIYKSLGKVVGRRLEATTKKITQAKVQNAA